ncbi:MAG: NAD(P)/FAD-dependent oxidoreductase, partial [Shewanella sp.]|uniref:flavin-containing monooxygenase n=1 Tax=Shewanella sp. TaxID=50422 RepID=UPI003C79564D
RNTGKFFLEHFFTKAVTGQFIQKHLLSLLCKANLRLSIKDKALREKLRPHYQVGCKRVIINSTFYKGIQKPNAHLITEGIERITETGIITKDGNHHELDVLVLSTGFNAFNFMRPMNLVGRNNVHIDKAWAHKIKAYRSMLLSDYPNFFLMLGPNTPIGNFSVIAMSEVQTDYVIKLIDKWRDREFDEFEAKQQAIDDFTAYVKEGLKGTSWVGGCQSWYLDADGDPILWPYTWQRWVDEMKDPQMEHINTTTF